LFGVAPIVLLQELKKQAYKLSVSDRLELVNAIIQSLQDNNSHQPNRKVLIDQMRGMLKTDQVPPTDVEVEQMLKEHRVEKYLE
jgi:hypothetical protein